MNFGIAISSDDTVGLWGHTVVRELESAGLAPALISCSGSSALSLMAAFGGLPGAPEEPERLAGAGCLRTLRMRRMARRMKRPIGCLTRPLAVCCVDLATGRPVIFTHVLPPQTGRIWVRGGLCSTAALGTLGPLWPVRHGLCDYAACQGAPVLPLRMAGVQRVLSVVLSGTPRTPGGRAAACLLRRSTPLADLTLEIPLQPDMPLAIRRAVQRNRAALRSLLWYGEAEETLNFDGNGGKIIR